MPIKESSTLNYESTKMSLPSWIKSSVTNWASRILISSFAGPSRWSFFMSASLKETTCFLSSSTSVMMIKMNKVVLTHLPLMSSRINPFARMLSQRQLPRIHQLFMPLLCNRYQRDLSKELRNLERCPLLVTSFGWNMRSATNSNSNGQRNWKLTNQLTTPRSAEVSLRQRFYWAKERLIRAALDLVTHFQPEETLLLNFPIWKSTAILEIKTPCLITLN